MKIFKPTMLGIIGFASIISLWIVGVASYQYTCSSFDLALDSIYYEIPEIVMVAIPVFLLIFSFISKRLNLKSLYFSALAGVGFPVLAYIFSCVFSNDGNILSYIYALTIGIIFYPFHWLAWTTFNGVWFGAFGFSHELCAGILVVAMILSLIIYKFTKNKNQKILN